MSDMPTPIETPEALIARYYAAVAEANAVAKAKRFAQHPAPTVSYERGWFVFHHDRPRRYRRAEVCTVIDRLVAYAAHWQEAQG